MSITTRTYPSPGQLRLGFADDPLAIRMTLEQSLHRDRTVVPEMGVCRGAARIDLALIGEDLEGFEIKADRDDLARLPSQVRMFGLVFDRLSLVTVTRHLEASTSVVPAWWGLQVADSEGRITSVREARPNWSTDPMEVAGLLWRDEVLQLIRARGRRGSRGTRQDFCRELVNTHNAIEIKALVVATLRARSSWRAVA